MDQAIIQEIENDLINGKLEKALRDLKSAFHQLGTTDLEDLAALQLGRLVDFKLKRLGGQLMNEDHSRDQIVLAGLRLKGELTKVIEQGAEYFRNSEEITDNTASKKEAQEDSGSKLSIKIGKVNADNVNIGDTIKQNLTINKNSEKTTDRS